MKTILLVFAGGGLGSLMRYGLYSWIGRYYHQSFPLATLVANVLACFILGFVIGLADHRQILPSSTRLFWSVGVCGGFSTFSTFTFELFALNQNGLNGTAALYMMLSVVCCLVASYLGLAWASHL